MNIPGFVVDITGVEIFQRGLSVFVGTVSLPFFVSFLLLDLLSTNEPAVDKRFSSFSFPITVDSVPVIIEESKLVVCLVVDPVAVVDTLESISVVNAEELSTIVAFP